jgi:hypothetical protein
MKGNTMKTNKKTSDHRIQKTIGYVLLALLFTWVIFITKTLVAQPVVQDSLSGEQVLVDPFPETEPDSAKLDTLQIDVGGNLKPYLGIVFGFDLDFEKAFALHYPYRYGAYIDAIEEGGPAERAGLMDGDIITRFGSDNVKHNDHFISLVENYQVGDTVPVFLFRNEKILETQIVLDAEKKPEEIKVQEDDLFSDVEWPERKKHVLIRDNDDGIMAWNFSFYMPDNLELYDDFLFNELGYPALIENRTINDQKYSGLNMTGFQFCPDDNDGSIRIGFCWANNNWNRQKITAVNNQDIQQNMIYSINYFGISLDKQVLILDRIYLSGGVLAGGLTTELDFYQAGPVTSWDLIGASLSNPDHNYLNIEKKYYMFQPNIAIMVPILGDVGLQLKLGYTYGIPRADGWSVRSMDGEKGVINSPNTSVGGYTFSIGPAIVMK